MFAMTSQRTEVFGNGIKVHSAISCHRCQFVRGTKTGTPAPPVRRPAHKQVSAKSSSARSSLNQPEKFKRGDNRREIRASNIRVDKGTRMKRAKYPALRSTLTRMHQVTNEAFDRRGKGRHSVVMPNIFAASDGFVFAQRNEHRAHKAPRGIGNTPASAIGKGRGCYCLRSPLSFS
jgi:hypothetical protein